MRLTLQVLAGEFTIHKLAPDSEIPLQVFESDLSTISKTPDELSLVCRSNVEIASEKSSSGWVCLKVLGPLDFSLTGILAGIAGALAGAGISIFAVSTFDTDYVFVNSGKLEIAVHSLTTAGYNVVK